MNTEVGHCDKTMAILQYAWQEIIINKQLNEIKYVVLSDDDTLIRYLSFLLLFEFEFDCFEGKFSLIWSKILLLQSHVRKFA